MTNIVKRLSGMALPNVQIPDTVEQAALRAALREALAEIERLRAEREANVAGLLEYENRVIDLMVENERLRNNEKAQLEGAAALLIADQNLLNEIERLRTRIEQLEERGNMADN